MAFQSKIADLNRLQEIIRVFTVAGFGDIFKQMGLEDAAEFTGKFMGWKYADEIAHLERPQRVWRVFEILGPTFVKLGQVLATRPDLFGAEWIAEFEKLQAQAPPLDFEELRPQIEADLGAPLKDIFEEVDATPLAAASVAQVHRATLKDGTKVVLKIQRPGIRPKIEADMRLLAYLASLAERHVPQLAAFHPQKVVQQFAKSLQSELNFTTEGHNAEQVAANFEGNDQILIPRIYWEWTRERINVQEFVDGIPGLNLRAIDAAGMDRKRIAQTGASAVLKMIIMDGLFHADPHPGNFFILPGERIAFIDFGMIGRVSEVRRQQITMPPDQAMLLKVFVSLEGAFKKLDPDFDMMVAIQPTMNEVVIDQLSPQALGKRGLKVLTQYVELFADLPKEIRRGIYTVKTGNLKIRVELSQLDEMQRKFMRGARLLALAGITSAVLIGGSILMALTKKPRE